MWLNQICILARKKRDADSAENWSEMGKDYREEDRYNDFGKRR